MRALLNGLHPLVVYGHRHVELSLALSVLLATQETRLVSLGHRLQHQLFVVVGLCLICLLHQFKMGVVSQLAIYIIICIVVHAQCECVDACGTDGVENVQRLVIHTYV